MREVIVRGLDRPRPVPPVTPEGGHDQKFQQRSNYPKGQHERQQRPRAKVDGGFHVVHRQSAPRVYIQAKVVDFMHVLVQPFGVEQPVGPIEVVSPPSGQNEGNGDKVRRRQLNQRHRKRAVRR